MAGLLNIDTAGIGSALSGIGQMAKDIRTAITGIDPTQQAVLTQKLADIEAAAENAQAEINKIEAASPNLFISGWRPFIGWVCGMAFGLNFLALPIAQWVVQVIPVIVNGVPLKLFSLDLATMLPVLLGMLGIGGMRTIEKLQGAQGNH